MALARRKWLAVLGIMIPAAVGSYFLTSSDEHRVMGLMREVLHAAELRQDEPAAERKARIAASFAEHLEPDVRLEIPELASELRGRAAVEALALNLQQNYVSVRFKIEQTEFRRQHLGAQVTSSITFFARDRESELRDNRQVTLEFIKHFDRYRLVSVRVGARSREEPEARP